MYCTSMSHQVRFWAWILNHDQAADDPHPGWTAVWAHIPCPKFSQQKLLFVNCYIFHPNFQCSFSSCCAAALTNNEDKNIKQPISNDKTAKVSRIKVLFNLQFYYSTLDKNALFMNYRLWLNKVKRGDIHTITLWINIYKPRSIFFYRKKPKTEPAINFLK